MKNKNFLVGNVIKTKYGHIEIVVDTKEDYINTIFIDSTNSSSGHKLKDYKIKQRCYCNRGCGNDPECKNCKGTGEYMKTIYGYEHAKLLASNIKEYILNRLTKNFEFL